MRFQALSVDSRKIITLLLCPHDVYFVYLTLLAMLIYKLNAFSGSAADVSHPRLCSPTALPKLKVLIVEKS